MFCKAACFLRSNWCAGAKAAMAAAAEKLSSGAANLRPRACVRAAFRVLHETLLCAVRCLSRQVWRQCQHDVTVAVRSLLSRRQLRKPWARRCHNARYACCTPAVLCTAFCTWLSVLELLSPVAALLSTVADVKISSELGVLAVVLTSHFLSLPSARAITTLLHACILLYQ